MDKLTFSGAGANLLQHVNSFLGQNIKFSTNVAVKRNNISNNLNRDYIYRMSNSTRAFLKSKYKRIK